MYTKRRRRQNNYCDVDRVYGLQHNCCNADEVYGVQLYEGNNDCGCDYVKSEKSIFPEDVELAQSYVPWQRLNKIMDVKDGLCFGTVFPELVSPYVPGQSEEEIYYLKATDPKKGGCNDA